MLSAGIAAGYVRPLFRVALGAREAPRAVRLFDADHHCGRVLLSPEVGRAQLKTVLSGSLWGPSSISRMKSLRRPHARALSAVRPDWWEWVSLFHLGLILHLASVVGATGVEGGATGEAEDKAFGFFPDRRMKPNPVWLVERGPRLTDCPASTQALPTRRVIKTEKRGQKDPYNFLNQVPFYD
ncbi:hypothetical protein EVAR_89926_1 [Eumeta japonica]|uniref:Uncharacterized protein n=1 Tax=Eumeta variegata TaxID=151549 RepID=A0A4C1XRL0_EUMVA|nr:hypothetical protein EVAR_89926_1 [Eumeta japonica]